MSKEKIEFVKPPTISPQEQRLKRVGAGLLLAGLFAAGLSPSTASGGLNSPTVSNGAEISWTGTWVEYAQVVGANGPESQTGNLMHLCSYDTDFPDDQQSCVNSNITSFSFRAGTTGRTFYTDDTFCDRSGDCNVSFGTAKYVIQFVYHDMATYVAGYEPQLVGSPLVIQATGTRPPRNQTPPPSTETVSTRSTPAAPPIALDIKVALTAASLVSGPREYKFKTSDPSGVVSMSIDGKAMPILKRTKTALKVRVPLLRPGTYDVAVSSDTDRWVVPNAITIGELPLHIQRAELDESFEKFSSELPKDTKQEIRALVEDTEDLERVTVFAIAKREIIGNDRNKLARSRASSAIEYINDLNPGVRTRTEIIHYTEVDLTSRGLFFQVTKKK